MYNSTYKCNTCKWDGYEYELIDRDGNTCTKDAWDCPICGGFTEET
jgi:rubrerythrin